ncbi:MAG TPA: hypothetical protein VHD59_01695 [Pseudolabrys sp.]|jgi:hypothetical protein|nr:hypothetical protein [Pseudolabrys sp.]
MPVFPLQRNFRVVIGCALGSAMLLAAAPASAQQDENAPEVKVLDGLMGMIGLSREAKPGIDYRERSPLVIPSDVAKGGAPGAATPLPPPESNKVADPNWPVDPEVKEARRLAAKRKESDGRTSSQIMDDNGRPLLPSELDKGRTNRKQNNANNGDRSLERSSWSELGYKGGIFGNMFKSGDEVPAAFTGEAPRTSLIEPPSGYQTPSPAQPYAVGRSSYKDKATDYYTEHGTNLGK